MKEEFEQLAQVTAAELGYEVVHYWQDDQEPRLLRIEAQHKIGKDRITVIFTKLIPESWLPLMTALVSAAA